MARIAVLGGTGYAGGHIVQEAAARGHEVTAWSRSAVAAPIDSVTYRQGSLADADTVTAALRDVDVVIGALSPRGDMAGRVAETYRSVAQAAAAAGIRFFVVGGAGSLLGHEGGDRLLDGEFPEEYKAEALELAAVLDELRATTGELDWVYVSPPAVYGAFAVGERTGEYRVGGDVLLTDADGNSTIGGADFAIAVLDEVEKPAHKRQRFTVAY